MPHIDVDDNNLDEYSNLDDEFIFETAIAQSDGTWKKRGYDLLKVAVRRRQNNVG